MCISKRTKNAIRNFDCTMQNFSVVSLYQLRSLITQTYRSFLMQFAGRSLDIHTDRHIHAQIDMTPVHNDILLSKPAKCTVIIGRHQSGAYRFRKCDPITHWNKRWRMRSIRTKYIRKTAMRWPINESLRCSYQWRGTRESKFEDMAVSISFKNLIFLNTNAITRKQLFGL